MTCSVTIKKKSSLLFPYTPELYHSKVDIDSLCREIQTLKSAFFPEQNSRKPIFFFIVVIRRKNSIIEFHDFIESMKNFY